MKLKRVMQACLALGIGGAAVLWACSTGSVVNSFEVQDGSAVACNPNEASWAKSPSGLLFNYFVAGGGHYQPEDQLYYGDLIWDTNFPSFPNSTSQYISLTLTGFANTVPSPSTNWSSCNIIRMAFVSDDATDFGLSGNLRTVLTLTDAHGVSKSLFSDQVSTVPSVTAGNWQHMNASLNYLTNLGLDPSQIVSVKVSPFFVNANSGANFHIGYDHLMLTTITANAGVPSNQITLVASCNQVQVSWSSQSTSAGADPIYGYHVYRSTNGGSSWTAIALTNLTTTSVVDNAPAASDTYAVLPYSISGTAGNYMAGNNTDPGVHEALLSAAPTAVVTQVPVYGPVAAPSNLTGIGCAVPQINLAWSAPNMGSYCNTLHYVVQREALGGSFSPPQLSTTAASTSFQDVVGDGAVPDIQVNNTYVYRVWAVDQSGNAGPAVTSGPIQAGPSSTCATPVPSTITPGVTVDPTPPSSNGGAYVYPNPFSPDKGEVFHVGNVAAGSVMAIYNMVGELVFKHDLSGDYTRDVWDGNNNNGVKVVTGVYFLTISGSSTVYKVAVMRQGK